MTDDEQNIILKLPEPTGVLKLSAHMLKNYECDAVASIRKLALFFGVDYSTMDKGGKVEVDAVVLVADKFVATKVIFRRTAKRGDRRVWISKLPQFADAGDTVAITNEIVGNMSSMLVINVTKAVSDAAYYPSGRRLVQ